MREVAWKDVLLNARALGVNVLVLVATFAILTSLGVDSARTLAVFGGLMASFFPVMIVTREDRARAMALSCSLPVTRRTIVRARYLMALVLIATGLVAILAIAAAMPGALVPASAIFRPGNLATGFAVAILIMSLMLPLTLRLGAMGLIVLMAVLQVIGVVLLTAMQVTGSSADLRLAAAIVGGVSTAAARLGTQAFYLAVAAVLAGVVALSYRASVFFFERREL